MKKLDEKVSLVLCDYMTHLVKGRWWYWEGASHGRLF